MAKRFKKKPFWERAYLSHGYWLGKERLGVVTLGPKKEWDGVYRWQAGNRAGEASTLGDAKRGVEEAVLFGTSQLPLFQDSEARK